MTTSTRDLEQHGQSRVDAKWLRYHPKLLEWFGVHPSQNELRPLKELINEGKGTECPPVVIDKDGTVITGWVTVCAYRELETTKIPVTYRSGNDGVMDTAVVAEVVKDALATRNIHDLMVAEAFQRFRELTGEPLAALMRHCGLGKTIRTLRRWIELLGLEAEPRKFIETGEISRAEGKRILKLPDEERRKLAAALRRGDGIRETLIDFGIINDEHGLSPHDSACRLLALLERYLPLWRENSKGFRSAYVPGGKDKLELIRESVHFLTYVRDELINDKRR